MRGRLVEDRWQAAADRQKGGMYPPFQSIGELGHFVERERGDIDAHLANADLRSRNWFRETQYIEDQGKPRRMRGTSR